MHGCLTQMYTRGEACRGQGCGGVLHEDSLYPGTIHVLAISTPTFIHLVFDIPRLVDPPLSVLQTDSHWLGAEDCCRHWCAGETSYAVHICVVSLPNGVDHTVHDCLDVLCSGSFVGHLASESQ